MASSTLLPPVLGLAFGITLRYLWFSMLDANHSILEDEPELNSPITSYQRFRETAFLYEHVHKFDLEKLYQPYQNLNYLPPLLFLFLYHGTATVFPHDLSSSKLLYWWFLCGVDVCVFLLLFLLAKWKI
ncbi:unnamed protein product, partial [Amoebophrya sp. A120]|eukprot:GSA120T00008972001.1